MRGLHLSRFTLEKEVLKLACKSFSKEKLFELKKIVTLQEELEGQKRKEWEFHKLDTQFHQIIFATNEKENIWTSIIRLSTHYNRIRILFEMEHSFNHAISQHKEILHIIENKDIHKVEDILKKHIIEPMKLWNHYYKRDNALLNYFDFSSRKFSMLGC